MTELSPFLNFVIFLTFDEFDIARMLIFGILRVFGVYNTLMGSQYLHKFISRVIAPDL